MSSPSESCHRLRRNSNRKLAFRVGCLHLVCLFGQLVHHGSNGGLRNLWWKTRFLSLRDLLDALAAIFWMNVGGHAGAVLAQKMRVAVIGIVAPQRKSIESEKETRLLVVVGVIIQHLCVRHMVKNILKSSCVGLEAWPQSHTS